jgi:hypothetical protein
MRTLRMDGKVPGKFGKHYAEKLKNSFVVTFRRYIRHRRPRTEKRREPAAPYATSKTIRYLWVWPLRCRKVNLLVHL